MKIVTNPIFETTIKKAVFNEQDILLFPHNGRMPENLNSVIKFLFGDAAVATEYCVDNFSCIRITGANFVLKNVKTFNADFIITKLNTIEVLEWMILTKSC